MTTNNGAGGLPPIERDESMDRTYIPLPGGWEVQTKGKGSTFRICDAKGDRMPITGSGIEHDELERMARDIHAAWQAALQAPGDDERGYISWYNDGWNARSDCIQAPGEAVAWCSDIALSCAKSLSESHVTRSFRVSTLRTDDNKNPLYTALARQQEQAKPVERVVDAKYEELLLAVGNKYPGESRHETALRYIRQAEQTTVGAAALEGARDGR